MYAHMYYMVQCWVVPPSTHVYLCTLASGLRRLALQRWRQAIDISRQWHAMNDQACGVDGGIETISCNETFIVFLEFCW